MPTFVNDGETTTLFLFNQVISCFGIPKEIVTNHGSHFQNKMMVELALKLGFRQEHSSPYYAQGNGQVETVNKSLKFILQRTINKSRSNRHIMLYPALWAYQMSVKTATDTSSLEECLVYLEHLDEKHRDVSTINKAHKKRVKIQYDKFVRPRVFCEGELVLVYDQDKDALGAGKFNPMSYGPFIIKKVLEKGAHEFVDFDGNELAEPRNGLYLKKHYA
eukprot:PITA_33668